MAAPVKGSSVAPFVSGGRGRGTFGGRKDPAFPGDTTAVVVPAVVGLELVVVPTVVVGGGKNDPVVVDADVVVVATFVVVAVDVEPVGVVAVEVEPVVVVAVVAVVVDPVVVVPPVVVAKQSSTPKPASLQPGSEHGCARLQSVVVVAAATAEVAERAA